MIKQTNYWPFECAVNGGYNIFPVSDSSTNNQARKLIHRVYLERGYAQISDEPNHLLDRKTRRPTLALLARNDCGETAGTISLVLDSPKHLPCDEIFGKEISALRSKGQILTEVTGLALSPKHIGSKQLLAHLMNFILIAARKICKSDTVLIEVNPRHENFYKRLLKFEKAGPVRPCHRVCGAPARLLSLDMKIQHDAVRSEAGLKNRSTTNTKRSLYKYFYALEEEDAIAHFLISSEAWTSTISPNSKSNIIKSESVGT